MPRRRRRSLALATALAAVGVALALRPVPTLVLRNEDRGQIALVPLPPGGPFAVVYQHSMYDAPVTEEFVVDGRGDVVLEAVSSPSAAVREYFGLTAAGERHAVVRPMRRIVFRVATGVPQRLRTGAVERSFLELGDHGDRIVLTAVREPALWTFLTGGHSAWRRRAPPSPPLAPGQPHPAAPALAASSN